MQKYTLMQDLQQQIWQGLHLQHILPLAPLLDRLCLATQGPRQVVFIL